jgi:hypothetical protein
MALGTQTKKVLIEVGLDDKASAGLKKLQTSTNSASQSIKAGFGKAMIAVTAVTAAVTGATVAVMKMAERAGKIQGLALGFERNFGSMEEALESFRRASQGMVSDFDLMQTANRAALLGVTKNVDELSKLMVTARLRGREMGMDMTTAFNDIVTGIGRGSPLILDNLGIKIPDAIKASMEKMGEAEKTQALLNFAIEDGAKIAKEYGDVQLTASEKAEILKSKIVNLKDEAIIKLSGPLSNIIDKIAEWVDLMAGDEMGLKGSIEQVSSAWTNFMKATTGEALGPLDTLLTMLTGWAYILGKIASAMSVVINKTSTLIEKYKQLNEEHPWNNPMTGITSLFPKRATGGITSGGMTMVGEAGPELVKLPRGSHVYNNTDSKEMIGGGGITINVNAPVTGVDNLKATIIEAVNEATARQNRLANYNLL